MNNIFGLNIDLTAAEEFCKLKPGWSQGDQQVVDAAVLIACAELSGKEAMLEIGTSAGEGAAAMLHGSSATGAKLHCIDFSDVVYYEKSKSVGSVVAEAFPQHADRLTLHLKNRCDQIRNIGEKFDLVHIDGNHSHPWGLIDMLRAMPFVKPGGLIVFHDANYLAAISQAAYYVARMIHGKGEILGNHFVFQYDGPSTELVDSLITIINTNWQCEIDAKILEGLYEDLCTTFPHVDAMRLCGALMTKASEYQQRLVHYREINGSLWQRELERRRLAADLAAAKA